MPARTKYNTEEERKKAHSISSGKYAKKKPEIYRTSSKSYYEKNKEKVLIARKEKRAKMKEDKRILNDELHIKK